MNIEQLQLFLKNKIFCLREKYNFQKHINFIPINNLNRILTSNNNSNVPRITTTIKTKYKVHRKYVLEKNLKNVLCTKNELITKLNKEFVNS